MKQRSQQWVMVREELVRALGIGIEETVNFQLENVGGSDETAPE